MPLLDTEHLLLLISESGVVERDVRAGRIDVIVCNRAAFMTELHEEDRELKRQIEEKAKDLVAVLLVQNESWSDVLALVLTVKQLKPMKAIGDA
jgi:hypothetical protein